MQATTEVDNRGTIHARDADLKLTGGTVRNRAGAKLKSAGKTELEGSLVNAGEVLATGDVDECVVSLDNTGSMKAGVRLNLTGTSNLTVGGLLVGNSGMGLAADGTLTSAAGSQLFSVGLLSLAISGDFTNSGALSITGDLTGTVNRFTNSGNLQVSNDIDVVVNDRLDKRTCCSRSTTCSSRSETPFAMTAVAWWRAVISA